MSVRAKFILNTFVGVVLGLLIFVFILFISNKESKQIDLTNNGRFTLSEQSVQAVQNLAKPIRVLAFVDERSKPKAQELMQRYQRVDSSKFSYELVFPKMQPRVAVAYDVRTSGVAVVEIPGSEEQVKEAPKPDNGKDKEGADRFEKAKTQRERASSISEEEITNAILKLGRHTELKVYALSGHGERDADGADDIGMSQFKSSLAKEGLKLESLNFAKDKTIPADCKVLVVAAPKSALLSKEEQMIRDFLKNNGRIFLMLEPTTPDSYAKLAADYGIDCPDQVILDPSSALLRQEPVFALGYSYDLTHPITKGFKQNTVFMLARPINVGKKLPTGAHVVSLASTSPYAFTLPTAEVLAQKSIRLEEGKYPPSVQSLAVAGSYPNQSASPTPTPTPTIPGAPPETKKSPESRLVVIGDADFLANANFTAFGARDLALNVVNWLAESENQISIRPKEAEGTPLRMTESEMQKVLFFQCLFLPLAVAVLGMFLSWRRR